MDAERVHLQRMIKILSDNLHTCEEQAAKYGPLDVPLSLKHRIEETREDLTRLKKRLAELETPSYPDQQPTASLPQYPPPRVEQVGPAEEKIKVLIDVLDNNIGIERIWPNRRAWQYDPEDGLRTWLARVCQANRVEIMSNTLWNFGMRERQFRRDLFDNIAQGASVRILLYDPDSDILRLRAIDEDDVPGEMQAEIKSTLLRLARGWDNLEAAAKGNLGVRLTTQSFHFVQIIRADELMHVAFYLSGRSGGASPTIQLRGSRSAYFDKYAEQFSIMWKRGRPLKDDDFRRMLEEFKGLPAPPTEE